MCFVNRIKSIGAKLKSKKREGIYCLSEKDVDTRAPVVLGEIGGLSHQRLMRACDMEMKQ